MPGISQLAWLKEAWHHCCTVILSFSLALLYNCATSSFILYTFSSLHVRCCRHIYFLLCIDSRNTWVLIPMDYCSAVNYSKYPWTVMTMMVCQVWHGSLSWTLTLVHHQQCGRWVGCRHQLVSSRLICRHCRSSIFVRETSLPTSYGVSIHLVRVVAVTEVAIVMCRLLKAQRSRSFNEQLLLTTFPSQVINASTASLLPK